LSQPDTDDESHRSPAAVVTGSLTVLQNHARLAEKISRSKMTEEPDQNDEWNGNAED
jgi:hypothetical protein